MLIRRRTAMSDNDYTDTARHAISHDKTDISQYAVKPTFNNYGKHNKNCEMMILDAE